MLQLAPTDTPGARRPRAKRKKRTVKLPVNSGDAGIPPDEIAAALESMLASTDFPATERNRRFLAHVVRCALGGRFEQIGGYQIATEVFGRPADFDPGTDPIVRIEAAKLRRDIETYYLKSGARSAVRISLPRGGYVPLFHRAGAKQEDPFLDPRAITVHALDGCHSGADGSGLRTRVIDRLVRDGGAAVFAGPDSPSLDGFLDSDTARDLGRRNGARFILSGTAQPSGGGRAVFTARLHDGQTGRLLWSEDIAAPAHVLPEALVARVLAARRELAATLDGVVDVSA